jgi:hypothetical protein
MDCLPGRLEGLPGDYPDTRSGGAIPSLALVLYFFIPPFNGCGSGFVYAAAFIFTTSKGAFM